MDRRLALFIFCISVSTSALEPIHSSFKIGVQPIAFVTAIGGSSSNRVSFLAGFQDSFFFNDWLGVFIGTDYTTRGARLLSGDMASASFLDFPAGVAFSMGSLFFEEEPQFYIHVGLYYAHPLSDLKRDTSVIQEAKGSYGGYVDLEVLYGLSEAFSLGLSVWGKTGFSPAFTESALGSLQTLVEVGVGGVAALKW